MLFAWAGTRTPVARAGAILTVLLMTLSHSQAAHAKPKKEPSDPAGKSSAPAKPKIIPGSDPGGIAVALLGSGVNYTLPQITSRLARDGEGDIIGLDFVDRDNRPFDTGPELAVAPLGMSSMGTTPASVILNEAPRARLVPVRVRLGEPRNFGGAMAFVAATPARIALVAFATPSRADWEPFEKAAAAAPHILLVLPAGDDGQNLDQQQRFPAGLGLANALVVAAADAGGRLLANANSSAGAVDVAVPAEAVSALALDGSAIQVSGSTAAAARVAALAARLLQANPQLMAADLKAQIQGAAAEMPGEPAPRTRYGWIAKPESVTYKSKP